MMEIIMIIIITTTTTIIIIIMMQADTYTEFKVKTFFWKLY
jgi:hypothetical protein